MNNAGFSTGVIADDRWLIYSMISDKFELNGNVLLKGETVMFQNKSKLVLGIVFVGLGLLLLIGMIKYASFLGIFLVYSYLVEEISGLGLNSYLAKAIAIPLGIGLWFAIVKLFFSWWEKKRVLGIAILALFFVLHSLALFFISRDTLVNPVTGEVKFCTVHPYTGTIQPFEQSVFDKFGQKAEPCTKTQIEQYLREMEYGQGPLAEVEIAEIEKGFLSRVTGEPLFFFCRDASGLPRFYPAKGYCPWGGESQGVTADVVREFSEKYRQRENDRKLLDELRQTNSALTDANNRLARDKAACQKENGGLVEKVNNLESSLGAARTAAEKSEISRRQIEQRSSELRGENSELSGTNRALESENSSLQRKLNETLKKADGLESTVDYYREKDKGCAVGRGASAAPRLAGVWLFVFAVAFLRLARWRRQ